MRNSNIRKAAVAGQFYPANPKELKSEVESFIENQARPKDAIACVMPHAGYMYSGRVAGKTISNVKVREKAVILGPNHTGYGEPFAIMTEGVFQMPFGDIEIDAGLSRKILNNSRYLKEDCVSHIYEHSLEVELPFLQHFRNQIKIVPITVSAGDLKSYKDLGTEISDTIKALKLEKSVLLVASSDMTHYESKDSAEKKDKLAIEAILELDENKLAEIVSKFDISMCGLGPVTVALSAAKALGAKNAQLIDYQTSGDVTGDYTSVVGYAGIIIF